MDFVAHLGPLALGTRLRRLSDRFMREVAELYGAEGVDFEPRFFTLFELIRARGPVAVSDAAQMLGVTHAAVSQSAAGLRKRGLISSQPDPQDGRRALLVATPAGLELADRLRALWAPLQAAVGQVTDGSDLLPALTRVERALDETPLAARVQAVRAAAPLTLDVVPFTPALAPHFERLNRAWIEARFGMEAEDRRLLKSPQAAIIEAGGQVLFAQAGGQVVGTVALVPLAGGQWELGKMAVDAAMRGKGVGKVLMQAVSDAAVSAGVKRVVLRTSRSLTPAIALYRRFGFTEVDDIDAAYSRCDLFMGADVPFGDPS